MYKYSDYSTSSNTTYHVEFFTSQRAYDEGMLDTVFVTADEDEARSMVNYLNGGMHPETQKTLEQIATNLGYIHERLCTIAQRT